MGDIMYETDEEIDEEDVIFEDYNQGNSITVTNNLNNPIIKFTDNQITNELNELKSIHENSHLNITNIKELLTYNSLVDTCIKNEDMKWYFPLIKYKKIYTFEDDDYEDMERHTFDDYNVEKLSQYLKNIKNHETNDAPIYANIDNNQYNIYTIETDASCVRYCNNTICEQPLSYIPTFYEIEDCSKNKFMKMKDLREMIKHVFSEKHDIRQELLKIKTKKTLCKRLKPYYDQLDIDGMDLNQQTSECLKQGIYDDKIVMLNTITKKPHKFEFTKILKDEQTHQVGFMCINDKSNINNRLMFNIDTYINNIKTTLEHMINTNYKPGVTLYFHNMCPTTNSVSGHIISYDKNKIRIELKQEITVFNEIFASFETYETKELSYNFNLEDLDLDTNNFLMYVNELQDEENDNYIYKQSDFFNNNITFQCTKYNIHKCNKIFIPKIDNLIYFKNFTNTFANSMDLNDLINKYYNIDLLNTHNDYFYQYKKLLYKKDKCNTINKTITKINHPKRTHHITKEYLLQMKHHQREISFPVDIFKRIDSEIHRFNYLQSLPDKGVTYLTNLYANNIDNVEQEAEHKKSITEHKDILKRETENIDENELCITSYDVDYINDIAKEDIDGIIDKLTTNKLENYNNKIQIGTIQKISNIREYISQLNNTISTSQIDLIKQFFISKHVNYNNSLVQSKKRKIHDGVDFFKTEYVSDNQEYVTTIKNNDDDMFDDDVVVETSTKQFPNYKYIDSFLNNLQLNLTTLHLNFLKEHIDPFMKHFFGTKFISTETQKEEEDDRKRLYAEIMSISSLISIIVLVNNDAKIIKKKYQMCTEYFTLNTYDVKETILRGINKKSFETFFESSFTHYISCVISSKHGKHEDEDKPKPRNLANKDFIHYNILKLINDFLKNHKKLKDTIVNNLKFKSASNTLKLINYDLYDIIPQFKPFIDDNELHVHNQNIQKIQKLNNDLSFSNKLDSSNIESKFTKVITLNKLKKNDISNSIHSVELIEQENTSNLLLSSNHSSNNNGLEAFLNKNKWIRDQYEYFETILTNEISESKTNFACQTFFKNLSRFAKKSINYDLYDEVVEKIVHNLDTNFIFKEHMHKFNFNSVFSKVKEQFKKSKYIQFKRQLFNQNFTKYETKYFNDLIDGFCKYNDGNSREKICQCLDRYVISDLKLLIHENTLEDKHLKNISLMVLLKSLSNMYNEIFDNNEFKIMEIAYTENIANDLELDDTELNQLTSLSTFLYDTFCQMIDIFGNIKDNNVSDISAKIKKDKESSKLAKTLALNKLVDPDTKYAAKNMWANCPNNFDENYNYITTDDSKKSNADGDKPDEDLSYLDDDDI